jgi:glyoxylate reductase
VKPKVLVTRRIFDESLAALAKRCDVETNQKDLPVTPKQLLQRMKGKDAVVSMLTDVISDACSRSIRR